MTLEEAIKILKGTLDLEQHSLLKDEREALKLGIEALKRIQSETPYPHAYSRKLLPGETEE